MKTWSIALRNSDWAEGSPSKRTMVLSAQPRPRLNTYGNVIFHFSLFNKFAKNSKMLFSLCHYGVLSLF